MKWSDAAETVLRTENRPLHYTLLARKIIQQKLADTKGRVRSVACYAAISSDDKWRQTKGKSPRFIIRRGIVKLAEWKRSKPKSDIFRHAQADREKIKKDLLTRLCRLAGNEFEKYLEELLVRMGYDNVDLRAGPRDEGIDLFCEMKQGINEVKTAVQAKCKQPHKKIGPKDVRYLRDVLSKFKCSQGVFITTSSFTPEAQAAAGEQGKLPIILIDGDMLAELALEHELGVNSQVIKTYAIDENFAPFRRPSSHTSR